MLCLVSPELEDRVALLSWPLPSHLLQCGCLIVPGAVVPPAQAATGM